jgi:hypothetical protein
MVQCFDMQRKHYSSPSTLNIIRFPKERLNFKSWPAGNSGKIVTRVLDSVVQRNYCSDRNDRIYFAH